MPTAGKRRAPKIAKRFDLRTLWYQWSFRTQLLTVIGAVNLLAAVVAGAIWILNTRTATRVEIEASLEVAQRVVASTINDLADEGRLNELSERLPKELAKFRHVRILLMNHGKLSMLSPQGLDGEPTSEQAPRWFARLVSPKLSGRAVRVVSATKANPVIVIGEPADEIAEAWHDFYSLALILLALDALVLAVLYVVLGRVLDPLASLAGGMHKLEGGKYATRLERPKVKELARITDRFNTLAGALDAAREENSGLYRQLIAAQEQERREIATELHDEAGPCLFGITANASSIKTFANQLDDQRTGEITGHVGEILSSAERLKVMNRTLLKKLRPGALGQVKLSELVGELVSGLQRNHGEARILSSVGKLANSYGETVDLTLYRCIQEGITNAIRHGSARNIVVDVTEQRPAARRGRDAARTSLRLVLRDDGAGFAPSTPRGFVLAAITERVRSLGGSCRIKSVPAQGTTVRIDIPIEHSKAERGLALI